MARLKLFSLMAQVMKAIGWMIYTMEEVYRNILIRVYIKDIFRAVWDMEQAICYLLINLVIKGSLWKIDSKEKACSSGMTQRCIQDRGRKTWCMGKENWSAWEMRQYMWVSLSRIKEKATANTHTNMVLCSTEASGRTTNNMELASSPENLKSKRRRAFGRKASW